MSSILMAHCFCRFHKSCGAVSSCWVFQLPLCWSASRVIGRGQSKILHQKTFTYKNDLHSQTQCSRKTPSTHSGTSNSRASSDFVLLTLSPEALVCSNDFDTESTPVSKSRSDHCSASSSPRRQPVAAAITMKGKRRVPRARSKRVRSFPSSSTRGLSLGQLRQQDAPFFHRVLL